MSWECAHFVESTGPFADVTVDGDAKQQSPTDKQQGMYRIAKRPMYDSSDDDDDEDSGRNSYGTFSSASLSE